MAKQGQTFTVNASAGIGGSITPSGTQTVNYGSYLFFKAAPTTGNGVLKWQVNGSDVQTGGLTYELNNITADKIVEVVFGTFDTPTVTDITPNTSENTGRLSVTNLAGTGFRTGVTVQLKKAGQPSITATNVVVVETGTKITCDFNFTSNATGQWDVVVTNDDGKSATLPEAVTLTPAPPAIASITPHSGVNNGNVAITNLIGSGFNNPAVILRHGLEEIAMDNMQLFGPTMITGSFDLTGKTAGAWDVVVTNTDSQYATLEGGFTVGAEPAPAPTSISPVTVKKSGTKTITINGTNFADDATVMLRKGGETHALTMSPRTATKLIGTIDISGLQAAQWDVVVTNYPSLTNEQSATMANALAITESTLTGVTLTTDKSWPQPTGATITFTATKTGTATEVEYQFWSRFYNQTTSQWENVMLRNYDAGNTLAWKPTSNNSYWIFVYARRASSSAPYEVASPEVYFKIEVATLTGVTLAVLPSSPKPAGTTITLTATKSGTVQAADVEYRFIYKWYNTATGKWVQGDIRGYEANDNSCDWIPTVPGQYRLYAFARIIGHTAEFDRVSPYAGYTVQAP